MGNEEKRYTRVNGESSDSLYEGAKTRFRVGLELSEEFEVKVCIRDPCCRR